MDSCCLVLCPSESFFREAPKTHAPPPPRNAPAVRGGVAPGRAQRGASAEFFFWGVNTPTHSGFSFGFPLKTTKQGLAGKKAELGH